MVWKQISAVLRREISERISRPGYWATTVLGMLVMIALVVVPGLIAKGLHPTLTVGSLHVPHAVLMGAAPPGTTLKIQRIATLANGIARIRHHNLTGFFTIRHGHLAFYGQVNTGISSMIAQLNRRALIHALPPHLLAALATAQGRAQVRVVAVSAGFGLIARSMAIYALDVIMMVVVMTYGVFIGMSVVEEKESRHAEMLMAWTRPVRLLLGKILGFFVLAFMQIALWCVSGLAAMSVKAHHLPIKGLSPSFLFLFLVWAVIGYLQYSTAFATLASRAQRSQEMNQAVMPLSLVAMLGYFGSVLALAHPAGVFQTLIHVAAFVPFLAPMLSLAVLQLGGMPWWQVVVDVVWQLAFWAGLLRVAAGLFHRHLLNYQSSLSKRRRWSRRSA